MGRQHKSHCQRATLTVAMSTRQHPPLSNAVLFLNAARRGSRNQTACVSLPAAPRSRRLCLLCNTRLLVGASPHNTAPSLWDRQDKEPGTAKSRKTQTEEKTEDWFRETDSEEFQLPCLLGQDHASVLHTPQETFQDQSFILCSFAELSPKVDQIRRRKG